MMERKFTTYPWSTRTLKDHRRAVTDALGKSGHEVTGMDDYT
jgi:hypothetical protein